MPLGCRKYEAAHVRHGWVALQVAQFGLHTTTIGTHAVAVVVVSAGHVATQVLPDSKNGLAHAVQAEVLLH